jgi:uncharacterized iron-regulated membrane protein
MGAFRSNLRRWHIWLGWIVGIPILFWTVSGLVMVARPIDEVRGTHLLREPEPVRLASAPVPAGNRRRSANVAEAGAKGSRLALGRGLA